MTPRPKYHVIERPPGGGWCEIKATDGSWVPEEYQGVWRYKWECEEACDELNRETDGVSANPKEE